MSPDIPPQSRQRLMLMYGLLPDLIHSGRLQATSRDFARWLGTSPVTIRHDISWVEMASTGAAYDLVQLQNLLAPLLEPARPLRTALVGLGDSGLSLWSTLEHGAQNRYQIVVGFESRLNRREQLDLPFPVQATTEIVGVCLTRHIEAALLCVEDQETHRCADRLVQGGVHYLVNFTHVVLRVNRHQVLVRECGLWGELPPAPQETT
ncbi:MAG: hypothetical protein HKM05_05125 [Spirochaetales bacterium]|nr:hypothetical protein [Spirochaetales bacterium]